QDYEKAMALWARLDRETPGREEYQRELANTYGNLAMVLQDLGRKGKDVQDMLTNAAAIQEKLVQANPNISRYRDDLARSRWVLGKVHVQAGHTKEAIEAYEAAVGHWTKLSEMHPAVLVFHERLADARLDLANIYGKDRQFAKAKETLQQAV